MSNITIVNNNDSSPIFNWQVGYDSNLSVPSDIKYRVTIRPYEIGSRIPMGSVLYEETGITTSEWNFSLDKNILASGGPYREYQVVIEAHDSAGQTSAGNQVGINSDLGWNLYPNGYDILAVQNPRFTGVQLQSFIKTMVTGYDDYRTGVSGLYNTISYIGPNGDISINFTSGKFDADLVGGYIFTSTGQFILLEAAINTGFGGIVVNKNRFDFNPFNPQIYHPTAAKNLVGAQYGYVSIGLYDQLDAYMIKSGIDVSTGLWLSNLSKVYNQSVIGNLTLISNPYNNQSLDPSNLANNSTTLLTLTYEGNDFPQTGDGVVYYYGPAINFDEAVIVSSGTVNNITSIVYTYPGAPLSPWSPAV